MTSTETPADYLSADERAAQTHIWTLPLRRALGRFPHFPMTTDQAHALLNALGHKTTEQQMFDAVRGKVDPPEWASVRRDDGRLVPEAHWYPSDVLRVLGTGAK